MNVKCANGVNGRRAGVILKQFANCLLYIVIESRAIFAHCDYLTVHKSLYSNTLPAILAMSKGPITVQVGLSINLSNS